MPQKIDKIRLSEAQDRRRKLTEEQKTEIKELYSLNIGWSLSKLAKRYEVSKKTILLIVNEESKRKNDEYIKEHWKEFQQTKEEHTKAIRKTRQYKKQLYDNGKLS